MLTYLGYFVVVAVIIGIAVAVAKSADGASREHNFHDNAHQNDTYTGIDNSVHDSDTLHPHGHAHQHYNDTQHHPISSDSVESHHDHGWTDHGSGGHDHGGSFDGGFDGSSSSDN